MADSGIGQPSDTRASDTVANWTVISLLKGILHSGGGGGGGGGGAVTIDDAADVTQGAIADAAVTAGASGTVNAHLRSISRDIGTVATASATEATAAKQDTGNTSVAAISTATGTIGDAAVTAGASGSLLALLRTLSRDLIANIVLKAGSAIIGQVGVDQTTPGTTDSVTVKASSGIGSLTESAPGSDTASSGLNGRLQRIAQRLTSMIAGLITLPLNVIPTVTSVTSNNADMIASTDVSNYRSLSFQPSGFGSASISVQGSNDNATWITLHGINLNTGLTLATPMTSAGLYVFSLHGMQFVRVRTTSYSSGTIAGNALFSTAPILPAELNVYPAGNFTVVSNQTAADAFANPTTAIGALGFNAGYNGATWDRIRVPTIVKTATATASGDTALWTPTSGKKFRVLRYMLQATQDVALASGAVVDVVLRDSTTPIGVGFSFYAPTTSVTTVEGGDNSGWCDIGNGYLSTVANNVLNINLSATLTSGKVRCVVCGTEE